MILLKNILQNIKKNNAISEKIFLKFIILFLLIYFLYVFIKDKNFFYIDLDRGDWPSYILFFEYTHLKNIFENHRTPGIPLILELFKLFDENLFFWKFFVMSIFVICIFYFSKSTLALNFPRYFILLIFILMVYDYKLHRYLGYPTVVISISVQFLSVYFFSKTLQKNSISNLLYLALIVFLSYQIRPSLVTLPLLFIFWSYFKNKFTKKFIIYLLILTIPLAATITLRYISTSHLGISPLTGAYKMAQVYQLIEPESSYKFNNSNEFINILKNSRAKLSGECTKSYNEILKIDLNVYDQRLKCQDIYFMMVWLNYLSFFENKRPFPIGDFRNDEPWKHVKSLSGFFSENSITSTKMDIYLGNLANEIIKNNKKKYFSSVYKNFSEHLKFLAKQTTTNWSVYLFFMIFYVFFQKQSNFNQNKIDNFIYFSLAIFLFNIINITLIAVTNVPHTRHFIIQIFLLKPVLIFWITYYLTRLIPKKN